MPSVSVDNQCLLPGVSWRQMPFARCQLATNAFCPVSVGNQCLLPGVSWQPMPSAWSWIGAAIVIIIVLTCLALEEAILCDILYKLGNVRSLITVIMSIDGGFVVTNRSYTNHKKIMITIFNKCSCCFKIYCQ